MTQPPAQYHHSSHENPIVPRLVSQQTLNEEATQESTADAGEDYLPYRYSGPSSTAADVVDDYALIMSELAQGELPAFRH